VGPHPIALAADVDNRDVVQEAVEGRAGRPHDPFIVHEAWAFRQRPPDAAALSFALRSLCSRKRRVDTEVARLTTLGATHERGAIERDGEYWVPMNDPEGNEFCVQ